MHSPAIAAAPLKLKGAVRDEPLSSAISEGEVLIGDRSYVTASRLADLLRKSPRTISRWNDARIGPPRIRIGKLILFDVVKVQDWLASLENEPVAMAAHSSGQKANKAAR